MNKYYCRECARELGYITYVDEETDFSGSVGSYKFKKFRKHTTIPDRSSNIVSIFESSDYETYKDYTINTAHSGSVEIDSQDRVNLIWFANKKTGESFEKGEYMHDTDGVKLALHFDSERIHPIPTGSSGFLREHCFKCHSPIFK